MRLTSRPPNRCPRRRPCLSMSWPANRNPLCCRRSLLRFLTNTAKCSLSEFWGENTDSRTQLNFDVGFNALDFNRRRPQPLDVYHYYCADPSGYCCAIDEHYLNIHTIYAPGDIKFSSFDYASFAELPSCRAAEQ